MKKIIISIVLCFTLIAAACFSWLFGKSDIQVLLFVVTSLFTYPLFEEGRKELKAHRQV